MGGAKVQLPISLLIMLKVPNIFNKRSIFDFLLKKQNGKIEIIQQFWGCVEDTNFLQKVMEVTWGHCFRFDCDLIRRNWLRS